MTGTVPRDVRKHRPQPAMRRSRRGLLARLRDDIAIMRALRIDYATIARRLRIEPEDARALSPKTYDPNAPLRLSRHAIKAMLSGRHAALGGKTIATRAKNLTRIAAAYTYEELLEEPGIGTATATQVQLWLEARGSRLRMSVER